MITSLLQTTTQMILSPISSLLSIYQQQDLVSVGDVLTIK